MTLWTLTMFAICIHCIQKLVSRRICINVNYYNKQFDTVSMVLQLSPLKGELNTRFIWLLILLYSWKLARTKNAQLSHGVFQTKFRNPILVQVMTTTSVLPLKFACFPCLCYWYYHVLMIRHRVWIDNWI
jgi:hypothetical protein